MRQTGGGGAAHGVGQVQLDPVVQVLEAERAVLPAREQAKDEEVPALPTQQVLD